MSTEHENTAVEETAGLTDAEKAYFESGGESPIEAEPEPAAEPEPQAQAEPQEGQQQNEPQANQPQDENSRNVPYGALREERERRKALEQQLAQLNGKWQTVEQRLAAMQGFTQHQQQQKPEEPKIPDPEEDFIEATRWAQQQITEMQRQQMMQGQRLQQEQASQRFQGQVMNAWSQRAKQAAQQSPEFADAYRFATTSRYRELIASGVPEHQARQQAQRDEFNFVAQSMQQGRDPAQSMIAIAQARGWQPKPASGQPAQAAPTAANTQQNTPAQPQRLDTVAKGMQANKSLSGVGSSTSGRGSFGAKDLAEMSDDDFAAFLDKKGANGFKAMLGG